MGTKASGNGSGSPLTAEQVLGMLTDERIKRVGDSAVCDVLGRVKLMVLGMAGAFINPTTPEMKMVGSELAEVNINLDDAKQLVADAEDLMSLVDERERKISAAQAATTKVEVGRSRLHDEVQSYSNIIRGQLGNRSGQLEDFGIKQLGGGKGGGRKKNSTGGSDKNSGGTDKNSRGSDKNSGGSGNNSGAAGNNSTAAAKS